MGLRSQEAVQSSQSLKTWLKAISRGETRLKVVFGTKGGRPVIRQSRILAQGFSEKESLALTATDLGHGDGRGRWVKQVYGYRWREE